MAEHPIVLDCGSSTTRIGSASDDQPRVVIPTCLSRSADVSSVANTAALVSGAEYTSPISLDDGLVTDWDGLDALLKAGSLQSGAGSSSSSSTELSSGPVLVVEPLHTSKADRERWAQLLFESHGCPGLAMCKAGVLALYANARVTGLAVDMGYGGVTITPVQEGFPLLMGARRVPFGGRRLDETLWATLGQRQQVLEGDAGAGAGSGSSYTQSALAFRRSSRLQSLRDSCGHVYAQRPHADETGEGPSPVGPVTYTLPDGAQLSIGEERATTFECLWGDADGSTPGLQHAIIAAALACDPEVRNDLLGNTVLTGGASCTTGMPERLAHEIQQVAPPGAPPRLAFASSPERLHGPWLGGSILASLDVFPDMTLTAQEYKEGGAAAVHKVLG